MCVFYALRKSDFGLSCTVSARPQRGLMGVQVRLPLARGMLVKGKMYGIQ
jgi:hypothetical protein